jgi:hypothetical protein
LDGAGHVIEFRLSQNRWRAREITGRKLMPIHRSLVGFAVGKGSSHVRALYGLNSKGELIQYLWRKGSWQSRNISRITSAPKLAGQVAAAAQSLRRSYVYALTTDNRLVLFTRGQTGWTKKLLGRTLRLPRLESDTLVAGFHTGNSPYVMGRDLSGNLVVVYRPRGIFGQGAWKMNNVGRRLGGAVLRGELATQFDEQAGATLVYSRDRGGRIVQFVWNSHGRWSFKRLERSRSGKRPTDLAASKLYHGLYTETVDGAIAEYLETNGRGADWHKGKIRLTARRGMPESRLVKLG